MRELGPIEPNGDGSVDQLALGVHNDLWVAEDNGKSITRFAPQGRSMSYPYQGMGHAASLSSKDIA